jgi:hypothetical protein
MSEIEIAVRDGKGLKEAFHKCTETKTQIACRAEVNEALFNSEVVAISNYTIAAEINPRAKPMFDEIKADEVDHRNLLQPRPFTADRMRRPIR